MPAGWNVAILIALVGPGCISREALDLSGKQCPCREDLGYMCMEGVCVRPGGGPPTRADAGGGEMDGATLTDAASGEDGAMMMGMDAGRDGGQPMMVGATQCLEAEAGEVSAPMEERMEDRETVVGVADGTANQIDAPADDAMGRVTFTVTIPEEATYRVWGRVIAPTDSNDSFWIRVNDGDWNRWNQLGTDMVGGLKWRPFYNDEVSVDQPLEFMLAMGEHTIDVHYREGGASIDKILVTSDTDLVPMDEGCE